MSAQQPQPQPQQPKQAAEEGDQVSISKSELVKVENILEEIQTLISQSTEQGQELPPEVKKLQEEIVQCEQIISGKIDGGAGNAGDSTQGNAGQPY